MNSNNRFLFLAVILLTFLAGCNPAPKYVRPPAQTPASFKEGAVTDDKTNTGWKVAQPGDANLRGKWWEIYSDPQLNALEEQVAVSNQSLKAAEANFRAARAQVVVARAALFPTIGSAPAYTNSRTSGTLGARVTGANNEYSLPFDISYTPDFWHRTRNAVDAQTFTAQSDAASVATALLSTQAALATDYFELRAVDMQKKILVETMQNYQQNVDLTTTLYKTGINSEQELVQAQNQLDTARAQATDLGVARAQYEHAIAILMGKPPAEVSIVEAAFNAEPPTVPVGVPSTLLERRPDIAAEERLIAAANAQIGVARAAYYPALTLSAAGGVESFSFLKWFSAPSRFWALGPQQLSYTIWEGGARRGQNEQAQAQYDAAVANYRQTVLTAFQSVEDQLSTLKILTQEIGEQQTAINSSQRYLDLAQVRFKAGVDSYLNVITAQNSLLVNRESQVSSELRRLASSVQLVLALGGGWDPASLPQAKDLAAKRPVPKGEPLANTPN